MDATLTTPAPPTTLRGQAERVGRAPLGFVLLACAAILVARQPDLIRNPQFWAEDGPVFFLQSQMLGVRSLFEPSAGYLHTVLRGVAWLATRFDIGLAPAVYVGAAFLCTLYVAGRTQSARFPLPASIGYALAVVLVPDAFEVLLTLTNLQWVLAGGLLLVLIAQEPARRGQRIHDMVALILLGLTGPFVIALFPLFVWRAWAQRTRFSLALALVAGACAAIQAVTIYRSDIQMTQAPVMREALLAIPGVRIGGSLFTGGRWGVGIGIAAASMLGAGVLALIAYLGWRPGAARRERAWLALAFFGLLAMSLYRCRYALPAVYAGAGSRYFFPLQLIVLWLLVAAAGAAGTRVARLCWAALLLIGVVNVSRLREPGFTDYDWPRYAMALRRGERVKVHINPDAWEFTVPGRPPPTGRALPPLVPRSALLNVSARCRVTSAEPAIVGFALHEGPPRRLLVRAVGPSLGQFGVRDPIAHPVMTLLCGGTADASFRPARDAAELALCAEAAQRCHAFAIPPGTRDVCAVIQLGPGVFTLQVASAGASGEVLVEIYEIPPAE